MVVGSFLVAIVLHEFGHAVVASWLGDSTPRDEGRQTLSFRSHIDPLGTLLCVMTAFQPGLSVGLGWGKPVKLDPWKIRRVNENAGLLLIAWAGPLFNLLIGTLVALIIRFLPPSLYTPPFAVLLPQLLIIFASVNICLTLLNLLPVYPLDGFQILRILLPRRQSDQFARSEPYGPLIILALFFLLPFLAQFSGLANFPLFQLPYYFWLGSINIISLVSGKLLELVMALYAYPIRI
jgi:Zn-dependent protease